MSHWTSLSLGALDQHDFAGHWVLASLDRQLLFKDPMRSVVASSSKPIMVFQVLGHGRLAGRLKEALSYIRDTINPNSIVVGVCTSEQAQETFGVLRQIFQNYVTPVP